MSARPSLIVQALDDDAAAVTRKRRGWTMNYRSPVSVTLMQDLVWSMNIASAKSAGTFMGRDLITGEEVKEIIA